MPCPKTGILENDLTFTIQAKDASGSPVDADSLPTYKIYEEETGTEIASGTMSLLDDANTTGFYSEQIALTTANGYERLKTYTIRVLTEISTVSVAKAFSFLCLGESDTVTAPSGSYLTTTARFKSYAGITSSDNDTLIGLLIARATSAIQRYCQRDFIVTEYREFYDGDGSSELCLDNFPITKIELLGIGKQDAFLIQNTSTDAYNAFVSVSESDLRLVVKGGANADDSSLTLANYATITALITAISALGKGWQILSPDTRLGVWSPIEILPTSKGLSCLNEYVAPQIPDEPAEEFTTDAQAGILHLFGIFCRGFQNITVRYFAGYAEIPADLEQICIDLVAAYYNSRNINTSLKSEKLGDYSYTNFSASEISSASGGVLPADISSRLEPWRSRSI